MALTNKLEAIGDAIREKTGTTEKMTLEQMATAISGITGGGEGSGDSLPEEAFVITGNGQYRFAYGGWDWYIENYGDRVTTMDVQSSTYMFSYSTFLKKIPFDINLYNNPSGVDCSYMFANSGITAAPYVKGAIQKTQCMFRNCNNLTTIPEDWADYVDFSCLQSYVHSNSTQMFNGCHSLRYVPQNILNGLVCTNNSNSPIRTFYKGLFTDCYALDKINLPVQQITMTSSAFTDLIGEGSRLKELTFLVQEDGTPYTVSWKSQTIDLSKYVGFFNKLTSSTKLLSKAQYHGITSDKQVKDDASYALLKLDPDWFTENIAYSRYNHDSAVNTINSLPDASVYLATAGGTNTIKFTGASGSSTDGGAINALTEEELAVGIQKGWTITFV